MRFIRCIYIAFFCIAIAGCGIGQKVKPITQSTDYQIVEEVKDFHVDNLGNIYILNGQNKVVRYSSDYTMQFDYSNNLIGPIQSIDATNPQKVLCFIKDFNRILVLDNALSEINIIDLSTSEYLDVSVVARSNDNQLWLFDPINQALVKVNDLVEVQVESNRLSDLNLGLIEPVFMKERGNVVALSDPNIGILLFDNFGQFLKLIPEQGVENFQLFGDYLFFVQGGNYYQYHIKRYEKTLLKDKVNGFERFFLTKDKTYYIDANGISVELNKK